MQTPFVTRATGNKPNWNFADSACQLFQRENLAPTSTSRNGSPPLPNHMSLLRRDCRRRPDELLQGCDLLPQRPPTKVALACPQRDEKILLNRHFAYYAPHFGAQKECRIDTSETGKDCKL